MADDLDLRGVSVRFGGFAAVDGIDLHVPDGGVTAIMGPSGCGKSTLLRAVAGLEPVAAGRISFGRLDLAGVPVHRRGIGLMFQDYLLFPHLTVEGNVAFGLRMAHRAPAATAARVAEVLELVGLAGYGARAVSRLSGGEQQRVALARALAPAPRLLMLDEPLGALDRTLRERLLVELREIFERLGIPIVYVTHDQEEAFAVADRVVVMRAGRIEQEGAAEEVWRRPATEFVARFLGFGNVGDARVEAGVAATSWGRLPVPADAPAGTCRVVLRPGGFHPVGVSAAASAASTKGALGSAPPALGEVDGVVDARTFRGDHFLLRLQPAAGDALDVAAGWTPVPRVGDRVRLMIGPDDVIVLPAGDRSGA